MDQLQKIIDSISNGNIEEVTEALTDVLANIPLVFGIVTALVCLFFAFFSYKLFKFCLFISGAAGGYMAGVMFLAPLISKYIDMEGDTLGLICGIICAVICGALALALYKIAIFVGGAAGGFVAAYPFALMLLSSFSDKIEEIGIPVNVIAIIICVIVGIIAGIIVYKLFKPIFIIVSSISLSVSALSSLAVSIFGIEQLIILGVAAILGFIIGIFAMVKQFKMNAGSSF